MTKQELQIFIGTENLTLVQAMRKIDENTNGILFLVNKSKQLIGCITDGDIRRFLLAGGKIEDPVLRAANMHPKFAYTIEEARHLYHERDFIVIPILNENRHIVDLFTVVKKPKKNVRHFPFL